MSDNFPHCSMKAIDFLMDFRKNGYHNLVASHPVTEKVVGITRPAGHPELAGFIERYNGKRNLYFSVNEPDENAPNDKLTKLDIGRIHAVWIDADPKKNMPFDAEKERLLNFADDLEKSENPPTYIIDSGGGIQAFWVLERSLEATKENILQAEAIGRGLAEKYETDRVQNIDRIMRIPFTVNIPTAKKKGRKRTTARVIYG